jgi:hypothetical protein
LFVNIIHEKFSRAKDFPSLRRLSGKGFMKRTILFAFLIVISSWQLVFSQSPQNKPAGGGFAGVPQNAAPDLPRFDLDFAGGTPQQLVDTIKERIGTLNAIIPVQHKDVHIPPLKMRQVNAAQLFDALSMASSRTIAYQTGFSDAPFGAKAQRRAQFQEMVVNYGFRANGPITPETVWYFYNGDRPENLANQNVCRFYQLEPYLQKYKVDDITTAIRAGWKMLGEHDVPQLNYHEDTKLLIGVGREPMLDIIDSVLAQLTTANPLGEPSSARRKPTPELEKKQP